jgi:hypothetical protein
VEWEACVTVRTIELMPVEWVATWDHKPGLPQPHIFSKAVRISDCNVKSPNFQILATHFKTAKSSGGGGLTTVQGQPR